MQQSNILTNLALMGMIVLFICLSACTSSPTRPDKLASSARDQTQMQAPQNPTVCSDPTLNTTIQKILTDTELLNGAQFSLVVNDGEQSTSHRMVRLCEYNANQRLFPASTLKLLVAMAALDNEKLGPDYRFKTSVLRVGAIKNKVLVGDLYLKGQGDSTMTEQDYDKLARDVADQRIHEITGCLHFDDTAFDANLLGHGWMQDDEPTSGDAPPISALTIVPSSDIILEPSETHDASDFKPASIRIDIKPAATIGDPVRITTIPSYDAYRRYPPLSVTARTSESASTLLNDTLVVTRQHGTDSITIAGHLPINSPVQTFHVSIANPTRMVADIFQAKLQKYGVKLDNPACVTYGVAPPEQQLFGQMGVVVAQRESKPLAKIVQPLLTWTINGYAETLTKRLAKQTYPDSPGSWDNGIKAIKAYLDKTLPQFHLGYTYQYFQSDGSGLSRYNSINAVTMADLLTVVNRTQPQWFNDFYTALPLACKTGTLAKRMCQTSAAEHVRAKTGTMTRVTAIAGYIDNQTSANHAGHHRLIFTIMTNNAAGPNAPIQSNIEDQIIEALATWKPSIAAQATVH